MFVVSQYFQVSLCLLFFMIHLFIGKIDHLVDKLIRIALE